MKSLRFGLMVLGLSAVSLLAVSPVLASTCGDSLVEEAEQCDDGGTVVGDGCSDVCVIESGYACDTSEPSVCVELLPPSGVYDTVHSLINGSAPLFCIVSFFLGAFGLKMWHYERT